MFYSVNKKEHRKKYCQNVSTFQSLCSKEKSTS
jgi:hypothetical protein